MPAYAQAVALLIFSGLTELAVGWYFREHEDASYRRSARIAIYLGISSLMLALAFFVVISVSASA